MTELEEAIKRDLEGTWLRAQLEMIASSERTLTAELKSNRLSGAQGNREQKRLRLILEGMQSTRQAIKKLWLVHHAKKS